MRIFMVVLGLCFLGACGPLMPASAALSYAMIEGAVVANTQKTMPDHVISAASGKDCSVVRLQNDQTYCVEDQVHPEPAVYCYRELGGVTCYDRPDPREPAGAKVGDNTHNYVKNY
jgi:hypothetical protein